MSYVELHAHSAFSFLDGTSDPGELAEAAHALGYEAFALTDHNSVSGSMEFAKRAKELGLRAIHGAEIDVVDDVSQVPRHLTLLVQDASGWRSLCRILTRAHELVDGERPKQPAVPLPYLEAHAEGLVCLSGCARSGVRDEPTLRRLLAAFGRDRFGIELQRPFLRYDRALNRGMAALAERLGVRCVATGNVHAHTRERAALQDVFVALREHATLDASEPLRRGNWSHVLTRPEAMEARFADHPQALRGARELAEQLRFDLRKDLGYAYPNADDPAAPASLRELCWARLAGRYKAGNKHRRDAEDRLREELQLIDDLKLSGFFLLHHELLELAREVALEVRGPSEARAILPPGRGRGSSVSSIVCFLTGLSHVDPVEKKLSLGRFLSEGLVGLPDIDLDFPRDIREVLIPRVHQKYGKERSALVAAFPTFRARGTVRELGKALGLPAGEIERVARAAEPFGDDGVETGVVTALGARKLEDPRSRWSWLVRLAREAYQLPRHLSQHSGGMIISTRPLVDCCPVVPAAMEGRQICQWDKDSCSDAGFLKIDLLGLGMLSAVERCVDDIARRRGRLVDLTRVDLNDEPTWKAIEEADTTGVFQIESRAQMASLRRTRPRDLDDLTIQVAIVRPGPIVGGAVNPYIARLQEKRKALAEGRPYTPPREHPSLADALDATLGTIIFQDQVIEVARDFAGFTLSEAEGLRRAMSRKRSKEAIEGHRDQFIDGALATHPEIDRELAERIFQMVSGFSGFGFPKAHGAAFALLAYQSTYLRVHYGPEFLCALLNEQPMGFYPADTLAHEAMRRGIEVLAPDVNESAADCTVEEDGRVRIGLGYLNGARRDEMAAIVAAREAGGRFRSLADLASRAAGGRPGLEVLAWSGACDALVGGPQEHRRRRALWELGVAAPGQRMRTGVQGPLPLALPEAPRLRPLGAWEAMVADYAATGMTVGQHPMSILRPTLGRDVLTSFEVVRRRDGLPVRVGGLVVARQRPETASGIVFLLIEDELGTTNAIVPTAVYEKHRLLVRTEPLLLIEGRVENPRSAGGHVNVMVDRIQALDAPDAVLAEVHDITDRTGPGRPLPETVPARERRVAAAGGSGAAGPAGDGGEDPIVLDDFRAVAPPVLSFAAGRRR